MANKKSYSGHARIVVGLPNLQDQIGMINRATDVATEPELEQWEDIGLLLSELYSQLQHQKQVTVYRLPNKNQVKPRPE